ncbi:GET complex subunit get1 [Dimargaris xerosporica]|nr:GET complex subunit get1 [Dimargaris xerosporica]
MYLLLFIVLLSLVTEICLSIGYSKLATKCWHIYREFAHRHTLTLQRKHKQEALHLKAEIRHTNAQDEFAKWAKLKRRLDKCTAAYDAEASALAFAKSGFEIKFMIAIRVLLHGLRTFVLYWYRAEPVFYVPLRWFDPFTPLLAYPFAPSGSVSVFVWMFVCHRVCHQVIAVARQSIHRHIVVNEAAPTQAM